MYVSSRVLSKLVDLNQHFKNFHDNASDSPALLQLDMSNRLGTVVLGWVEVMLIWIQVNLGSGTLVYDPKLLSLG